MNYFTGNMTANMSHAQNLHAPSSSFYRTQLGEVGVLTRVIFALSDILQPAPRISTNTSSSLMRDPAPALLRGGADIHPVQKPCCRWVGQFLSMIVSLSQRFL